MTEDLYEQLVKLSGVKRISIADTIRECIKKSVKIDANEENLDPTTKVIRQCIDDIMTGYLERVASMIAKSCRASMMSTYLSAFCISSLIHPTRQKDFDYILEKAQKYAGAYLKSKNPELYIENFVSGGDKF